MATAVGRSAVVGDDHATTWKETRGRLLSVSTNRPDACSAPAACVVLPGGRLDARRPAAASAFDFTA